MENYGLQFLDAGPARKKMIAALRALQKTSKKRIDHGQLVQHALPGCGKEPARLALFIGYTRVPPLIWRGIGFQSF